MAKSIIMVGSEFTEAYQSIVELIKSGALDRKYTLKDGNIFDGTYEYELTNVNKTREDQVVYEMTKKGASWFEGFRGGEVSRDNAIWCDFVQKIGQEYHKAYSVVEYKEESMTPDRKRTVVKNANKAIENFFRVFYPTINDVILNPIEEKDNFDNIYSLFIRLDLTGGSGSTFPVLVKVYFSETSSGLIPLSKNIAMQVEENISSVVPDEDDEEIKVDENVLSSTLLAFEKFTDGKLDNISNYMFYATEQDEQNVLRMVEKLRHDNLTLECQHVNVLYITHLKLQRMSFEVIVNKEPSYVLDYSSNDTITLTCNKCNEDNVLVINNHISFINNGKAYQFEIDPFKENLGLTDIGIDNILNLSTIAKHNKPIKCNLSGLMCNKTKCASQVIAISTTKGDACVCKDCYHKEKLYFINNVPHVTSDLGYAINVGDLVPLKDIVYCKACGRAFTEDYIIKNKCKACYNFEHDIYGATKVEAKEEFLLYKRLRTFMPLGKRFISLFKKDYDYKHNFARIDEFGDIHFCLKGDFYILPKIDLVLPGYIREPRKMK